MKADSPPRRLPLTPRQAGWLLLALSPLLAWIGWQLVVFRESAIVAAAGAALAAWLVHRRWTDALALGGAALAADFAELGFAAHVFVVLALPLHALTRRARFSALWGVAVLGLLLVAAHLKQRFAGSILTWQDVHFFFLQFGDNVGVMATQPTLLLYTAVALGLGGGACVLAWRSDGAVPPAWRAAQAIAIVLSVGLGLSSASVVHGKLQALRAVGAWTLGQASAREPLSAFFATAAVHPAWTVPLVDTSGFRREVGQHLVSTASLTGPRADIVLVLQESQFNPATIAGCPAKLCDLPAFHATQDTVDQGPMQVHVFGGGTWATEFALATGVPHWAFGPAGDFAPFNVAPAIRRSFIRSLKAAGYRTVAVYPVGGGMMNARSAYGAYGYDRFYDAADLGLPGRFNTSDEEMHAAARRVLEQERKAGQPVFLLLVTIFNHADHGIRLDRVPGALLAQAGEAFGDPSVAQSVADYVWRTREFERAAASTGDAVLGAGRPAVFAWFGDHQPPFGGATSLRSRIQAVATSNGTVPAPLQTWYQVRSNAGHSGQKASARALDIVFLPGMLAEAAGVPIDDWLAANIVAREQCGGLLQACRRAGARDTYLGYLQQDLHAFQLH